MNRVRHELWLDAKFSIGDDMWVEALISRPWEQKWKEDERSSCCPSTDRQMAQGR